MNNITSNTSNIPHIPESFEKKPILNLSLQITPEIIQENNTPLKSIEEQKTQIAAKNLSFENKLVIDFLKKIHESGLIQKYEYDFTLQEFIVSQLLKSLGSNSDPSIEKVEIFLGLYTNLYEDMHNSKLFKENIPILFNEVLPENSQTKTLLKICLPLFAQQGRIFFNKTLRELLNEKSEYEDNESDLKILIILMLHQLAIQKYINVFYKSFSKAIYSKYLEIESMSIKILKQNVVHYKTRNKLTLLNSADKGITSDLKKNSQESSVILNNLQSSSKNESVMRYLAIAQKYNVNFYNMIMLRNIFKTMILSGHTNEIYLNILKSGGVLKLTSNLIQQLQNNIPSSNIKAYLDNNLRFSTQLQFAANCMKILTDKNCELSRGYYEIVKKSERDKNLCGWFFNDIEADDNEKIPQNEFTLDTFNFKENSIKPKKSPPKLKDNNPISSKSLKIKHSPKNPDTEKKVPQLTMEKKKSVEPKSKIRNSNFITTAPVTSFQDKIFDQNLDELSKEILSFNKIFTDYIKESLNSQQLNVELSESDFVKANKCSKELRDHFNYLSLNLNLFCKTVNSDLYALGAIVPFMCMSFHLVIEQHIKHGIIVKGLEFQPNHNLRTLCEFSDYTVGSDQQDFIEDFKRAMIQIRYPIVARDKIEEINRPNSLKWTLFSKTLCENIVLKKDEDSALKDSLSELCDFLFDSYEQTIKCLLNNLETSPVISLEALNFIGRLTRLKEQLQSNIKANSTSPLIAAIVKKHKVSQNGSAVLDQRKTILYEVEKMRADLVVTDLASIQPLEEAVSHLLTLDSVDYLQQNYASIEFAALHHRNSLMFQWVLEQIYTFKSLKIGQTDFREIPHHDLEAYHFLTLPDVDVPLKLNEFNFGRGLHYSHERKKDQALPMIQDLLKVRKYLKKVDASEPEWTVIKDKNQTLTTSKDKLNEMKQDRRNNFLKGVNLVKDLLKLVFES